MIFFPLSPEVGILLYFFSIRTIVLRYTIYNSITVVLQIHENKRTDIYKLLNYE